MNARCTREGSILTRTLGDSPKLWIIDFFLDNKFFDFSKKEIIEGTGLNKITVYKYFDCLLKDEIVVISRKFGKTKLYTLNRDDPQVKALVELDLNLSKAYADKIEKKSRVYA